MESFKIFEKLKKEKIWEERFLKAHCVESGLEWV